MSDCCELPFELAVEVVRMQKRRQIRISDLSFPLLNTSFVIVESIFFRSWYFKMDVNNSHLPSSHFQYFQTELIPKRRVNFRLILISEWKRQAFAPQGCRCSESLTECKRADGSLDVLVYQTKLFLRPNQRARDVFGPIAIDSRVDPRHMHKGCTA